MGSKNKLKRFKENETFPNVIQTSHGELMKNFPYKGKWNVFFKNDKPIILELGCGKGEYTIALAEKNPNVNCIGVDIKGARFWRGAKTALEKYLPNVAFVRTKIEFIDYCFLENEVSEIWITFPDPQIKYKRTKHRLTNEYFLKKYHHILKKKGIIHLKTDSEFIHGYTLGLLHAQKHEILYSHHDIYSNPHSPEIVLNTKTFYEEKYLEIGKAITYIKFILNY